MPWKEVPLMDERLRFVARLLEGEKMTDADSAASRAVEAANLVLIPCRPSAFDLAAIKTTVSLLRLFDKTAYAV